MKGCETCGHPIYAIGLCRTHYDMNRGKPRICTVARCRKMQHRNGRCMEHNSDYSGTGVIACASCGNPLRDHSLLRPCYLSPLSPTSSLR